MGSQSKRRAFISYSFDKRKSSSITIHYHHVISQGIYFAVPFSSPVLGDMQYMVMWSQWQGKLSLTRYTKRWMAFSKFKEPQLTFYLNCREKWIYAFINDIWADEHNAYKLTKQEHESLNLKPLDNWGKSYIYIYIYICLCVCVCVYLTPPNDQDATQGQFQEGFNRFEFRDFLLLDCLLYQTLRAQSVLLFTQSLEDDTISLNVWLVSSFFFVFFKGLLRARSIERSLA